MTNYNRFYNSQPMGIEPAGTAVADLVGRLLEIRNRREDRERREALDAQAQIDTERKRVAEDEERAVRLADLRSKIANQTSLVDVPQVEKTVDEGSFTNPEEADYMSGTDAMEGKPVEPGFLKLGTLQTTVPVAPRTQSFTLGGESFSAPLRYREDLEADANRAFDVKLDQEAQLAGAKRSMIRLPNEPDRYGKFAGMTLPEDVFEKIVQYTQPKDETFDEYLVDGQRQMLTPAEVRAAKEAGVRVTKAYAPREAGGGSFQPYVVNIDGVPTIVDKRTGQPIPNWAPADTAEMRNRTASRSLVAASIAPIQTLSEKLITKVGPAQRMTAAVRGFDAVLGNDPEYKTYQDARFALAGNLAVGQQGSRPSDADIKSIWLPLVPDVFSDTKESAEMKWKLIRTMSNADQAPGAPVSPGVGGAPNVDRGSLPGAETMTPEERAILDSSKRR